MGPDDSPVKAMIFSLAALVVLVITGVILFAMIEDPSGFFRSVEYWIEDNL